MRPDEHTPLSRAKAVSQIPPSQPLFETLLVFENYRLDTVMRSLGGAWANRIGGVARADKLPHYTGSLRRR